MLNTMIQLPVVIIAYFTLVYLVFDKSIAPVGKKLQRGYVHSPKQLVNMWVLVAGCLFPALSFVKARKSDWERSESLGAMSVILGLILGMTIDVSE